MGFKHKKQLQLESPMDWSQLMNSVERLSLQYDFLTVLELGKSILGKSIPLLRIGQGRRSALYVGAHHGMEWITSMILLLFVDEICQAFHQKRTMFRQSIPLLLEQYTVTVIPMLNPDGVDYQIHGINSENPLYNRVLSMNRGNHDFSRWQANARGVDLNHNYDAGFREYKQMEAEKGIPCGAPTLYSGQEPESEPEVRALCDYIRFQMDLRLVLTLHTQGEELFYKSHGYLIEGTQASVEKLSSLTGYHLSEATGTAAFGGLTDWCITKQQIPSITMECGKGVNPLPSSSLFPIYSRIREALFLAPTLF